MVCDVWVEADVGEMLGDDFGFEVAKAKAFAGGLVVVELLDELLVAEGEEGFAGDLGVVFGEGIDPFSENQV